jgi:SAM-dependent methyltransferase
MSRATRGALAETRAAFDCVAGVYDRDNSGNPIIVEMRRRLWAAVEAVVVPGSRLLDLGCGPGPDAEHFARRGHRVVALDGSAEMVSETRRRVVERGLESLVEAHHLGIEDLDRLEGLPFDAAYSDLGPLNCVLDMDAAAKKIADRLAAGGFFVASVIGRYCPWEIALYGVRLDWKRVRVRFASGPVPVPFYGGRVWTRYYTPSELERALTRAGLTTVSIRSLGLLLPPPYLTGFARRHPRCLAALARAEDAVASVPLLRQWGDHFLIVSRKEIA